MRYLAFLIFIFSLSFACSNACPVVAAPSAAAPDPPEPVRKTSVHAGRPAVHFLADTDFTPLEREHIRNAGTAWTVFSGSKTRVDTEFTADFETAGRAELERFRDSPMLLRVDSSYPIVGLADAQHPGMSVLAFTLESGHVFLVMDRIDSDQFVWVVIHEMGHVLGLEDLPTRGAVMSGIGRFGVTWFTEADREECKRSGVCP